MTKTLEEAIAKLRALPEKQQEEVAELLLSVVEQDPSTVQLTEEQAAEIARRLEEQGEYSTHEQVRAFFHKQTV